MAIASATHESRLEFKLDELLASPKLDAPLIAGGVRCHGGFDADGRYVSPRTLWRNPAVKAWQEQHLKTSPLPLVEVPKDAVPPHLPSVAQAKLLLKEGVREPMIRTLTEIAIVEGFGATIRELPVPPLESFIRENVTGTALAHLTQGLFEAHARDEAGWGEEGGHKQMWEAARDLALSNPKVPGDILMAIMGRRGNRNRSARALPELHEDVERVLGFMMNVLIIEVFAASTFRWAEEVLADPDVSDAPQAAADMVRYIRSDESPHVEYLRTALSEISARTLVGDDGKEYAGNEMVQRLLDRFLRFSLRQRGERRNQLHETIRASAKGVVKDVEELIQRFDALETEWQPPARYLDDPDAAASALAAQ